MLEEAGVGQEKCGVRVDREAGARSAGPVGLGLVIRVDTKCCMVPSKAFEQSGMV